jgi:glycosyltransferase involved in cell wall biosynthesis
MKTNILLISLYFPPDLSAGAFRAGALIKELEGRSAEANVLALVGRPSRYVDYAVDWCPSERAGNVVVRRIWFPVLGRGFVAQAFGYAVFMISAVFHGVRARPDVVIGTTSRFFTGFLAYLISKVCRAKLVLDVRDLFFDTVHDVFEGRLAKLLFPMLANVERLVFRRANLINVVSGGFVDYVQVVAPGARVSVFTNGLDDGFSRKENHISDGHQGKVRRLKVVYAGNVGDGQALDLILPGLASRLSDVADFLVVGSGGRIDRLRVELAVQGVSNVVLRSPVPRDELLQIYHEADVLFLHLNAVDAFEKVIPSKIFEYAAIGVPVLAGLSGYPARFLVDNVGWARVFSPCDVESAALQWSRLSFSIESEEVHRFCTKFDRKRIMRGFVDEIFTVVRS